METVFLSATDVNQGDSISGFVVHIEGEEPEIDHNFQLGTDTARLLSVALSFPQKEGLRDELEGMVFMGNERRALKSKVQELIEVVRSD